MSQAIKERCNSCKGRRYVEKKVRCSTCRGHGTLAREVKKKCKACKGTGRYVKKWGKHNFKVTPCIRCKGEGEVTRLVPTNKKCPDCEKGKKTIRIRCRTCRGKGRVILNRMGQYWPDDSKLVLA